MDFKVSDFAYNMVNDSSLFLKDIFDDVDKIVDINSMKVLNAFWECNLTEAHFNGTTGYGYNDCGRDVIEKIFAKVFEAQDALVRGQFISGSHALSVCLFALLRPNDTLLSITGKLYDTMDCVIGIRDNPSSLKSYSINFSQIDLIDSSFDYDKIRDALMNDKSIKVVEIQRSKGYSLRNSIDIDEVEKVIKFIKNIRNDVIVMIDNCYCEFVSDREPISVGADIVVGSLIKNLGGGISPNGAYIVGRKDLIKLCSERLNLPGEGKEVGPSLNMNRSILLGLYMAPLVVGEALKTSILCSYVMEKLGYQVNPKYNDKRADIVQNIIFNDKDKLIKYCQAIQNASSVDANTTLIPSSMPGYDDKIIMASGSFTQGSSIELSCDGPIREPYVAYQQGSLSYSYGKIAMMKVIDSLRN